VIPTAEVLRPCAIDPIPISREVSLAGILTAWRGAGLGQFDGRERPAAAGRRARKQDFVAIAIPTSDSNNRNNPQSIANAPILTFGKYLMLEVGS
jgi:hypothetical protein